MTKSTITDERITSVIERLEHYACNLKWTNVRGAQDLLTAADGLRELHERRKADRVPVVQMFPEEPPEHLLPKGNSRDTTYRRGAIILGWKLCRAAMLAAAPQSPGSEPATAPGKWIPVSERMPETDGNYWGWWSESKRQGPVWFIKSELQAQFQSSEITHWMPLPAAPQEVR
ncbi:TPA: DUF551 domain-containing protein [Klebsiella quasipneumoniae]|nr:DUF551 domain-containing protein [Klebsiella quasipneumoniae]